MSLGILHSRTQFGQVVARSGFGINSPVHYIDHADVRNLHRIAMNILENAIEKQTTFKVVSEIKT